MSSDIKEKFGLSYLTDKLKTQKVKIAVCVDNEGKWNTYGYGGDTDQSNNATDRDMLEMALNSMDEASVYKLYFIEAEIPIPTMTDFETIQATVIESTITAKELEDGN